MAYSSPEKRNAYARGWYQRNKSAHYKRVKRTNKGRIVSNKILITNYLLANPCVDCGMKDVRTLDFDHVRGVKIMNISQMLHRGVKMSTVFAEIAKCEVRCANCHRIKTSERREANKSNMRDGDDGNTHGSYP